MSNDDPVNSLPLAELIKHVMDRDGLTNQMVLTNAGKRGVWDLTLPIMNWMKALELGDLKDYPKSKTIEALAAGLGITYNQVLHACTRQMKRPFVWRPEENGATVITDDTISTATAVEYGRRVRRAARKGDHGE